jgi:hypothetical protein
LIVAASAILIDGGIGTDLQHQGLRSGMGFNSSSLLPNRRQSDLQSILGVLRMTQNSPDGL